MVQWRRRHSWFREGVIAGIEFWSGWDGERVWMIALLSLWSSGNGHSTWLGLMEGRRSSSLLIASSHLLSLHRIQLPSSSLFLESSSVSVLFMKPSLSLNQHISFLCTALVVTILLDSVNTASWGQHLYHTIADHTIAEKYSVIKLRGMEMWQSNLFFKKKTSDLQSIVLSYYAESHTYSCCVHLALRILLRITCRGSQRSFRMFRKEASFYWDLF